MNYYRVEVSVVNGFTHYVKAANEKDAEIEVLNHLNARNDGGCLVVNPYDYLDACEGIETFLVEVDDLQEAKEDWEIEEAEDQCLNGQIMNEYQVLIKTGKSPDFRVFLKAKNRSEALEVFQKMIKINLVEGFEF